MEIVGYTFPFRVEDGKVPLDYGPEVIKKSITMILSWPMFTRYYNLSFGTRIEDVLEDPNDNVLASLIKTFIIEAISRWEDRVELNTNKTKVVRDVNKINITLFYTILGYKEDYLSLTYNI